MGIIHFIKSKTDAVKSKVTPNVTFEFRVIYRYVFAYRYTKYYKYLILNSFEAYYI